MRIETSQGETVYVCDFCGMSDQGDTALFRAPSDACVCEWCVALAGPELGVIRATKVNARDASLRDWVDAQRGRAAALARELDCSAVLVCQWASGDRPVPAERCPSIEKATGGKVRCEELRPDVPWDVLRMQGEPEPKAA